MSPTSADQLRARVGHVLKGKLRLERLLGIGGMAAVYEATHRSGARFAVKLLHHQLFNDPAARERFLREARAANSVGHPAIVPVYDDDVDEEFGAFLVMELLDGNPLDVVVKAAGGKLPVPEAVQIIDQLLDVLVATHGRRVIHRDLKPENLFLTREGSLRVLDFGVARAAELTDPTSRRTLQGDLMGTPAYMAPEQARGQWDQVDERADLYSVGAVLFNLLTGRVVHHAETVQQTLGLVMTTPAASVGTLDGKLPAWVIEFVDRSLAFEKADRWVDAASMKAALRLNAPVECDRDPERAYDVARDNDTLARSPERTLDVTSTTAMTTTPVADKRSATRARRSKIVGLAVVGGLAVSGWFVATRQAGVEGDSEAGAASAVPTVPPAVAAEDTDGGGDEGVPVVTTPAPATGADSVPTSGLRIPQPVERARPNESQGESENGTANESETEARRPTRPASGKATLKKTGAKRHVRRKPGPKKAAPPTKAPEARDPATPPPQESGAQGSAGGRFAGGKSRLRLVRRAPLDHLVAIRFACFALRATGFVRRERNESARPPLGPVAREPTGVLDSARCAPPSFTSGSCAVSIDLPSGAVIACSGEFEGHR